MTNISYRAASSMTNRYGYNGGNEYEDEGELNYSNTFYRKYDAQIGRFTGIDIKAEEFAGLTPYQFGGNNPVMFNDPKGDKLTLPGRPIKGPDGNYHTGWVSEMMWGNLGFFSNEYLGGGGGGGGNNFTNIRGWSSQSILSQMSFGQQFGKNKRGEYGFFGGVVTSGMVQGYYQQLWGSTHKDRENISAKDARGENAGLGFGVGWTNITSDFSVSIGSIFLSNESAQNLFFAYTNISVLVVNSGVHGVFDVGHTAIQVGKTIYGYYPKNGDVFRDIGVMNQNTREQFNLNYKKDGYTDFTLSVSKAQANLLTNRLNGYVTNLGVYSIFGQQCTSISISSLLSAGIYLQSYNANFGYNQSIIAWSKSPDEFRTILGASVNSKIVTGFTAYP